MKNHKGTTLEKIETAFYLYTEGSNIKNKEDVELTDNEHGDYKERHLLFLGVYHQHPEFRELFHDLNVGILNFYKELIKEGIAKKEIKDDINVEEMSLHIFTLFMGSVELSIVFPEYSSGTLIDTNLKILWEAIKMPEV